MTSDELKALIETLRINHEYNEKEVFLQAADELERLLEIIEDKNILYEVVRKQRDALMSVQTSIAEALRAKIQ